VTGANAGCGCVTPVSRCDRFVTASGVVAFAGRVEFESGSASSQGCRRNSRYRGRIEFVDFVGSVPRWKNLFEVRCRWGGCSRLRRVLSWGDPVHGWDGGQQFIRRLREALVRLELGNRFFAVIPVNRLRARSCRLVAPQTLIAFGSSRTSFSSRRRRLGLPGRASPKDCDGFEISSGSMDDIFQPFAFAVFRNLVTLGIRRVRRRLSAECGGRASRSRSFSIAFGARRVWFSALACGIPESVAGGTELNPSGLAWRVLVSAMPLLGIVNRLGRAGSPPQYFAMTNLGVR